MKDVIIGYYRGRAIKNYNTIRIRVSQFEIKKFIDAKLDHGFSARKVLENSGNPCSHCTGTEVIVFDKDNNSVKIKKGILKKK